MCLTIPVKFCGGLFILYNIMNILEKEIEDTIESMIKDYEPQCEDIGVSSNIVLRQTDIPPYGTIDLLNLSVYRWGYKEPEQRYWEIKIIELKRNKIGYNELGQLCRYVKGVKRFVEEQLSDYHITVSGVLIGKELEVNGDFVFLANLLTHSDANIDIYTFSLDYKTGLRFNFIGDWSRKNESFDNVDLNQFNKSIKDALKFYLRKKNTKNNG